MSVTLHGEGGDVVTFDHAKIMEHLRDLAMEYGPTRTYNMDKTWLFYNCLPNRGYVELEKKQVMRGSKNAHEE